MWLVTVGIRISSPLFSLDKGCTCGNRYAFFFEFFNDSIVEDVGDDVSACGGASFVRSLRSGMDSNERILLGVERRIHFDQSEPLL